MSSETTPLLFDRRNDPGTESQDELPSNQHLQFCRLVGLVPSHLPPNLRKDFPKPGSNTLYERARHKRRSTQLSYAFTSSLSNTLLLSQVVLGATLTALGAADISHTLVAVFGALNTVIAGVIAYLKSRGQPMRSRMFRDDLERVVDEIENSEIMWYGISRNMHGYDDIDIEDEVSVRSEVARLTRLYDRAIRNNTLNNPDAYYGGQGNNDAFQNFKARAQPGLPTFSAAVVPPVPDAAAEPAPAPVPAATTPAAEVDESPAKADPKSDSDKKDKDDANKDGKSTEPPGDAANKKAEIGKGTAGDSDKKDAGSGDDATSNAAKKPPADPSTQPKAPAAPIPAPRATEPPPGLPLGADIDEGPVTAPTKKKDKDDDAK